MEKELPKEPQKELTPPEKPTSDAPPQHVALELIFDLRAQRLEIRSKASTIMNYAILTEALESIKHLPFDSATPMPADHTVRATLTLDTATDLVKVEAQAPHSLLKGVVMYALGALTRNQISQHMAIQLNKLEQRLARLELKLAKMPGGGEIILPGSPLARG